MLLETPDARHTPPGIALRAHTPDVLLAGGETVDVAGIAFEVLAVPGMHPQDRGLVAGSVGRTDLPGADWETLLASIRSLVDTLPADTVVYPGHGPITTLGDELAGNPFLAELRAERTA